jgi:hypothetical protein
VGLRETLNQNPGLTTAATAIIIVAAIAFVVISMLRGGGEVAATNGAVGTKDYYSDDDGKTFFEDDRTKVPPYDHNGKTACRARLFTCDGGKTKFVGWLERYTPEGKRMMEETIKRAAGGPVLIEDQTGLQLKKPRTGDKGWVTATDQSVIRIRDVNCPNGTPAEPVPPP